MGTLAEFKKIKEAEEYFEFFDLEYDESLLRVKRFHIMRKFGEMIDKALSQDIQDEAKMLEFFKFALVTVYKNFESGYNPSAADIWGMFDKPNPCLACSTMSSCSSEAINGSIESNTCSAK